MILPIFHCTLLRTISKCYIPISELKQWRDQGKGEKKRTELFDKMNSA